MMSNKKMFQTLFKLGIGSVILTTVFSSVIISMLFNLYNDLKGMNSNQS